MIKGYKIITILLITDWVLYITNGISLSGQLGDKILFWIWLVMTVIITNKYFERKWVKWYARLLCILLMLSVIPMGYPLLALIGFTGGFDLEKKMENHKLRESVKGGVVKICVIKEYGILEKEIGNTTSGIAIENDYYHLEEFDDIKIKETTDSLNLEFWIGNKSGNRKFKKEYN